MKRHVPQFVKNLYHLAQAFWANLRYGFPSGNITVIGITGTNGKTTTTQMVARILEAAGKKVAMASTINFKLGEKEWVNTTKYTTLSAMAVQQFIREAVKAGCEYLVLETSSHSLDQYRVWGVQYKTAIITNVTREHLDYHKTMEKYRLAKLRLFRTAKVAVVNLDMDSPEDFLSMGSARTYGYTLKDNRLDSSVQLQRVSADNLELTIDGSAFSVQGVGFRLHLPGEFNVENALAAICVGLDEGIELTAMNQALAAIQGIPGRLEPVPNDRGLNIIIDYAVTPDSLEKVYALLAKIRQPGARIISVFGACGERDRGKRPLMGQIVSFAADYVIITNEDPYHEDPQRIINEVAAGVTDKFEGQNFWKIMDRREAIRQALGLAKPGDLVVVTGKGAEETMAVGDRRIPWNDKQVIEGILKER